MIDLHKLDETAHRMRKPRLFKRLTEALFDDVTAQEAAVSVASPPPATTTPLAVAENDRTEDDRAEAMASWVEAEFAPARRPAPVGPEAAPARPEPVGPPARQDPSAPPVRAVQAQARFEARLQAVAEQPAAGCAGKLRLLDLEEVKLQFGDGWSAIAERAMAIAEQVIRRRLAESDVMAPLNEHSYIVLFAELTEPQATLKAAAIAREIREKLLGEFASADPYWVRAFVTDMRLVRPPPTLARMNEALAQTPDIAPPPGEARGDPETASRVGEIAVVYRPIWFAPKQAVSTYGCRLIRLDGLSRMTAGPIAYPSADRAVLFEVDRLVLSRSLSELKALAARSGRVLINVPLHITSLIDLGSGQITDLLRQVPEPLRRFVTVLLIAPRGAAPMARLSDAMAALQPFCRTVSVRVPPGFADFDRLARPGVFTAAVDLEEAGAGLVGAGTLAAMVRGAHAAKLTLSVSGIVPRDQLQAALAAQVDFLSGPAVAADSRQLAAAHAYRPT